jgi:hypothetical protein
MGPMPAGAYLSDEMKAKGWFMDEITRELYFDEGVRNRTIEEEAAKARAAKAPAAIPAGGVCAFTTTYQLEGMVPEAMTYVLSNEHWIERKLLLTRYPEGFDLTQWHWDPTTMANAAIPFKTETPFSIGEMQAMAGEVPTFYEMQAKGREMDAARKRTIVTHKEMRGGGRPQSPAEALLTGGE